MGDADDQCNFEILSAMLGTESVAKEDDMSDCELNRLAALIEQEQDDKSEWSMSAKAQKQNFSLLPGESGSVNVALMEELRKMQEKIQILEAQLSKQTAEPSSSSLTFSPHDASSSTAVTKHLHQRGFTNVKSSTSKSVKNVVKNTTDREYLRPSASLSTAQVHLPTRVIKEVEQDIFFGKEKQDHQESFRQKSDTRKDSDSDWEDFDGDEKSDLNKSGQELKQLLKSGFRQRIAHSTVEKKNTLTSSKAWKDKASTVYVSSILGIPDRLIKSKPSMPSDIASKKSEVDEKILKDCYSGIRIINPKISSSQLQLMMENRRMIQLSVLQNKTYSNDVEGDWVTIGVVVHKSESRVSAKGTNFSFWKLSDLVDCDKTVTFFLFGNVNKELWKTMVGSVVGILNASIMPNTEKTSKSSSELSITVDNPQKVLIMGQSKDLGTCRGRTKNGTACHNVINIQQGEYCTYHVQAAYRKVSARRADLQSGHNGVEPKSFRKVLAKSGCVIYGGNEYFSTSAAPKKKEGISIKNLQQHHLSSWSCTGKAKVNTLALHEILPEDRDLLEASKQTSVNNKNKTFYDLLSVPSVGSMNFVKHLQNTENSQTKMQSRGEVKSITASDLLKQYQNDTKAMIDRNKKLEPKTPSLTVLSSDFLCPKLGRGLQEDDSVFLDFDDCDLQSSQQSIVSTSDQDKEAAVALIKAKGGLTRQDPNAVQKKKSSKVQEQIKKRVLEDCEGGKSSASDGQPEAKKSRLLGGMDLNSPDVQKLLKAKSAHASLLSEEEQEKQEVYFDMLEKMERMEEKMLTTMEVKCTAVSCLQCKYTAVSAAQHCRDESHTLRTHQAIKRFFRCKDCNRRCVSLDKMPASCCVQCGGSNFERTSMMQPKAGPKLPTEQLLLRGEERKFINSLN